MSNWILRFPLTIYSSDLHTKHTFESNSVKSCSNYVNAMEEGWKYFVITKNDGTRLYCTSQVFYVILSKYSKKEHSPNSKATAVNSKILVSSNHIIFRDVWCCFPTSPTSRCTLICLRYTVKFKNRAPTSPISQNQNFWHSMWNSNRSKS